MNFVSPFQPEREFKVYKWIRWIKSIIWFIVITENHRLESGRHRVYVKWSLVKYETSLFHNLVFFYNDNFRFSIKWYSRAQRLYSINMWSTHSVWKQYNKMAVLHFFLVNFSLYILFSMYLTFNSPQRSAP